MDYEDDDIYPENDHSRPGDIRMHDPPDDDEEEGEEIESGDSDDDIQINTETKPKTADVQEKPKPTQTQSEVRKSSQHIKREGTPQPGRVDTPDSVSRDGNSYPARHTSKLDPENANPVHPQTGKPIMSTDFDADFPDDAKPWRKPGADVTDWFNYGFDEFTWASWCLKKQGMPGEVKAIGKEWETMKGMLDGGMPAPMGMGAAMPMMPGMSEQDMAMMQQMMASGMDPNSMTPEQFGQMMMGGGNMGAFGQGPQPPVGPAGYQPDNFGGRGRGRGRRGNW